MLRQAQTLPEPSRHHDHFGINIRSAHAISFHADLVELAIAALLRPLITEHRTTDPEPLYLVVEHTVFNTRAHHAGSRFRAQGEFLTVAIVKGIHLFFDDVSPGTDAPAEQRRVFHNRYANLLVTISAQDRPYLLFQVLPHWCLLRQNIIHTANGLKLLAQVQMTF